MVHDNLADMSKVTSAMTYQKGSWVLHMLRQRMGDDGFWAGIRDYYARHRDGNASTDRLPRGDGARERRHDSRSSSPQWLYRGGMPRVEGSWSWDARTRQLTLRARQVQAGVPFVLTLDVGIDQPGAPRRTERLSFRDGVAELVVRDVAEPAAVTLDPDVRALFDGRLSRTRAPASRGPE